jgi:hypothetical protein
MSCRKVIKEFKIAISKNNSAVFKINRFLKIISCSKTILMNFKKSMN